jgi:hypothetical protein
MCGLQGPIAQRWVCISVPPRHHAGMANAAAIEQFISNRFGLRRKCRSVQMDIVLIDHVHGSGRHRYLQVTLEKRDLFG